MDLFFIRKIEVYSADDPQSHDYECGIWVAVKKVLRTRL